VAARDLVGFFLLEVRLRLVGVRVLRDREPEPPRDLPDDRDEDVLLLRDPGGEDVRVAMVRRLGHGHTSHTDHTDACRPRTSRCEVRQP